MSSVKFELSKLIRLSIPVVFSQVGAMSLNLVDTWVLGTSDSLELAGAALGNSIFIPIVVVSLGLMMGMDTLITNFSGKNDTSNLYKTFGQSILLSIVLSLFVSPLIYHSSQWFSLTGSDPEIVLRAEPYIKTLAYSYPLTLLFATFQRYWQSLERALPITIIVLLSNFINLGLDLTLVRGWGPIPPLGATGVGWATFGCRTFQLAAIIAFTKYSVQKSNFVFPPFRYLISYDGDIMRRLLRLSLPAAIQMGLEVLAFNIVTIFAARFGPVPLASHHIILSLSSMSFMFPMGIANATAIRVGIHMGKSDVISARLAGNLGIGSGAIVMALFAMIFIFFPKLLLGLFSHDPLVIQMALKITILCALFQVVDGIQVVAAAALRGIGNTKSALYANIISFYIIGLPLALYLCFYQNLELQGLWIGLAISLGLIAIFNSLVWMRSANANVQQH